MKLLWYFLRPTSIKMILLVFLTMASLFIVINRKATSKVSWQEDRGIPFPFVNISGYKGPCSEETFCEDIFVEGFHADALILDIVILYLISCTVGLYVAQRNETVKKKCE